MNSISRDEIKERLFPPVYTTRLTTILFFLVTVYPDRAFLPYVFPERGNIPYYLLLSGMSKKEDSLCGKEQVFFK
jgi:hypothetical protein